MAQSLSKIYLHLIFHTKTTSPLIKIDHLDQIYKYIGKMINLSGCQSIIVGGRPDHIHILCTLSRDVTVSNLMEEVKRNSSRWIKTLSPDYSHFAWQAGYAAFSVSQSVIDKTIKYINNQETHHTKQSFQDEYRHFLKIYNIEHDEKYIFTD